MITVFMRENHNSKYVSFCMGFTVLLSSATIIATWRCLYVCDDASNKKESKKD